MRDLEGVDADAIPTDIVIERFAEHTLQIAIQAAVDVASHIVADDRLGDAATNHALFDLLARNAWIPVDLVPTMHRMVGFRNVLVHQYDDVDVQVVRRVVLTHGADLQRFVASIRDRLATQKP